MRSRSLLWSFDYAIQGIVFALRTQRNMRLHAMAAIVALGAALFLRIGALELIALFFAISLVFVAELVNTAIEAAVDVATESFSPVAKTAKDVAAGAVLVAAINALAVGYVVFVTGSGSDVETVLTQVRDAPVHLTVLALAITLIAVIVAKAATRDKSIVSGGWPSGHSAVAFSVAAGTGFATRSAEATIAALFLAFLVAQTRVEAGIHSVAQVMIGALLGTLLTTAVFQLFLG